MPKASASKTPASAPSASSSTTSTTSTATPAAKAKAKSEGKHKRTVRRTSATVIMPAVTTGSGSGAAPATASSGDVPPGDPAAASPAASSPAAAPSPASSPAAAPSPAASPATAPSSAADYAKYIVVARALEGDVLPMKANLLLVLGNVKAAVAAVLAERASLPASLGANLDELAELPSMVHAVIFADTQILRMPMGTDLQSNLARGRQLRAQLLKAADSLAESGLLPRARVEQIMAGKGPVDMARDCIELAALFNDNSAAIAGKHPLTSELVSETAAVGRTVLDMLKSPRARVAQAGPDTATLERDQLWTLVVRRYDALWRVGAYLFGRDGVDAKVPALQTGRPRGRGHADTTEDAASEPAHDAADASAKPAATTTSTPGGSTVH